MLKTILLNRKIKILLIITNISILHLSCYDGYYPQKQTHLIFEKKGDFSLGAGANLMFMGNMEGGYAFSDHIFMHHSIDFNPFGYSEATPGIFGTPEVGNMALWRKEIGFKAKYKFLKPNFILGHTNGYYDKNTRYGLKYQRDIYAQPGLTIFYKYSNFNFSTKFVRSRLQNNLNKRLFESVNTEPSYSFFTTFDNISFFGQVTSSNNKEIPILAHANIAFGFNWIFRKRKP
jgi:hypothetical protein